MPGRPCPATSLAGLSTLVSPQGFATRRDALTHGNVLQAAAEIDQALGALATDLETLESSLPTGSPAWTVLAAVYDALAAATVHIINIAGVVSHGNGRPVARAVRRSLKRVDTAVQTMQRGLAILTNRYHPNLAADTAQRLWRARRRVPAIEAALRQARSSLSG